MGTRRGRIIRGAIILFVLVVVLVLVSLLAKKSPEREASRVLRDKVAREIAAGYEKTTDVRLISGTVLDIVGSSLRIETRDPNDYLPHADGSPVKTVVKFVTVTSQTQVKRIDETKLDASGGVISSLISIGNIHKGDVVTVVADHNVLNSPEFDAVEVRLVAK